MRWKRFSTRCRAMYLVESKGRASFRLLLDGMITAMPEAISLYTSFFTNKINDLRATSLGIAGKRDDRKIGAFDAKYPSFA